MESHESVASSGEQSSVEQAGRRTMLGEMRAWWLHRRAEQACDVAVAKTAVRGDIGSAATQSGTRV